MLTFIKKHFPEIVVALSSLAFSFWLMFATFSYEDGSMLISTKSWSDFASHIPLIRSFSFGSNFPPQYPIFSGEPIKYHYLFYLLAGMLERVGFRIDWALNLPSALSFSALMLMIYFLGKELFKNKAVGILSVIFFLFNSSLSFIEFFKTHPLSTKTFNEVITNNAFPSFGPYDGKIVSAFWNLNIYTNQRHLALALTILLLIVFFIVRSERIKKNLPLYLIFLLSVLFGIMPFLHSAVFLMMASVLSILFIALPSQRKSIFSILLIGALISLPRVLFLKQAATFIPHIQLGYLITGQLSFFNFLYYWFMNLGLSLILIPAGFLFAPKLAKKIFIAFLSLFLITNLFQFSIEMAGNHKFLNAFIIVGNMFSAFLLAKLWQRIKLLRIVILVLGFFLVLSGIIDFFPIKNDHLITLPDYPKNPSVQWIIKSTPKDSVFLNTSYLYNQASLAGRKIFLGWPYFPWSLGYDTLTRDNLRKSLLSASNLQLFCEKVRKNNLDYAEISSSQDIVVNVDFFEKNFTKVFEDKQENISIYNLGIRCK